MRREREGLTIVEGVAESHKCVLIVHRAPPIGSRIRYSRGHSELSRGETRRLACWNIEGVNARRGGLDYAVLVASLKE